MGKIKLNWGTGIVISCIIFMTATVITGITLMNQKVDLVTDNYYEKELKYQSHIDKLNRTQLIKDVFIIQYSAGKLNIDYTDTTGITEINGSINFYRPSDSAKDFSLPLQLNNEGTQIINTNNMQKGYWKLQLSWTVKAQEYYFEQPLLVN